jgi:hypothetical protein
VAGDDDEDVDETLAGGRYSKNYSSIESLMVSKAFISASEGRIGAQMKGAEFERNMGTAYKEIILAQLQHDKTRYEALARNERRASFDSNTEPLSQLKAPEPYDERNGKAILRHFRTNIAPAVTKFAALLSQNPMTTGENRELYSHRIHTLWRTRNGNKSFMFDLCYSYLRDKSKWAEYETYTKATELKRPKGGKKMAVAERDVVVIEQFAANQAKAILGKAVEKENAMEGSKGALYDSLGKFLQMGANYMDMLDMASPDKKRYKAAQCRLKIAEMDVKVLELEAKKKALEGLGANAGTAIDVDVGDDSTVNSIGGYLDEDAGDRANGAANGTANGMANSAVNDGNDGGNDGDGDNDGDNNDGEF